MGLGSPGEVGAKWDDFPQGPVLERAREEMLAEAQTGPPAIPQEETTGPPEDLHDVVSRLSIQVLRIKQDLANTARQMTDHELRIGALEEKLDRGVTSDVQSKVCEAMDEIDQQLEIIQRAVSGGSQ